VLSIDIFGEFTRRAGENLARRSIHNVTLETADAMALEARGRFDAIAVTG
jgi:protein-L-isoaspartate O-methyltransferase